MLTFHYNFPVHNRRARKRLQRQALAWLVEHKAKSSVLDQRTSARLFAKSEYRRHKRGLEPTCLASSNAELWVWEEFHRRPPRQHNQLYQMPEATKATLDARMGARMDIMLANAKAGATDLTAGL